MIAAILRPQVYRLDGLRQAQGEEEQVRKEKLHMFSGVHLHYEIDMCRRTASLLAGAPDGLLNNVLVESYAIHSGR